MQTLDKNPQLNEMEANLRSAANAVDGADENGVEFDLNSTKQSESRASDTSETVESKETVQEATSDEAGLSENQKADPDKSGTKLEEGDKKPETKEPVVEDKTGEDSKYAKLKKEQERKERSWKALEAEKEEVRKKEAQLEEQRKQIETERKKLETPFEDRIKIFEQEAKEYDQASKDFLAEGRDDLAERCKRKAAALRDSASDLQKKNIEVKRNEFTKEWDGNLSQMVKENPELSDSSSPLYKEVLSVLEQRPVLRSYTSGIKDAVDICKLRKSASLVPDLQKKLSDAEKKIKDLQASTQLPSSPPNARGSARKISDLQPDEQEAKLREMAAAIDAEG